MSRPQDPPRKEQSTPPARIIEVTAAPGTTSSAPPKRSASPAPTNAATTYANTPGAQAPAPHASAQTAPQQAPQQAPFATAPTGQQEAPFHKRPQRAVTQILGSPITPVVPEGYVPQEVNERPVVVQATGSDVGAPEVAQVRPEANPQFDRRVPAQRSEVIARAYAGASPDPSLKPRQRFPLREELLSLSFQRTLVAGVTGDQAHQTQKARVSVELALALAELGTKRVLLVEGDFFRPAVHRLLGALPQRGEGFSQQIHQRGRNGAPAAWIVTRLGNLDMLAEGAIRSPGLMNAEDFNACILELRSHYQIIVVNGPLFAPSPEYSAFDASADALLYVMSGGVPQDAVSFGPRKQFERAVE
ncbi:MAG: hypothetical protein QM756_37535 [Polyangiaceae bacterium]